MINTARVIVTYKCHRNCPECVNTAHPRETVPVLERQDLKQFDEVVITGGEPLLFPEKVQDLANVLKRVILYTAVPDWDALESVAGYIEAVTISLRNDDDVSRFNDYAESWALDDLPNKRVRVYYENLRRMPNLYRGYSFKMCQWKPAAECHLPVNEKLFRLDQLFDEES
jgi:organic radical activating enzyme